LNDEKDLTYPPVSPAPRRANRYRSDPAREEADSVEAQDGADIEAFEQEQFNKEQQDVKQE
jgi:hypothetical protein